MAGVHNMLLGIAAKRLRLGTADSDGSSANASSYTFSGLDFGTEASDRQVIIVASGNNWSNQTMACTVDGVAATAIGHYSASGVVISAWLADKPTDGANSVTINFGTSLYRCSMCTVAIYGGASATPTDTATTATYPQTGSVDVTDGGIAIGAAVNNTAGSPDLTWTGDLVELATGVSGEGVDVGIAGAESAVEDTLSGTCTCSQSASYPVGYFFSLEAA